MPARPALPALPTPERLEEHERLARRSARPNRARGRHLVVLGSGHMLQLDAPGVVVHVIRELVDELRMTNDR